MAEALELNENNSNIQILDERETNIIVENDGIIIKRIDIDNKDQIIIDPLLYMENTNNTKTQVDQDNVVKVNKTLKSPKPRKINNNESSSNEVKKREIKKWTKEEVNTFS
jgi:hypothetical protein